MSLAPAPDLPPFRDLPLGAIHAAVLDWYAANGRDLAFRRTTDPWAILVSEVMAQQTQAARAAVAWTRFMAQFPTPAALAAASPATVIRAWRGLGYNRRAVALRAAAIAIVEDHGGRVPDSLEALVALPGVGPYTARAVARVRVRPTGGAARHERPPRARPSRSARCPGRLARCRRSPTASSRPTPAPPGPTRSWTSARRSAARASRAARPARSEPGAARRARSPARGATRRPGRARLSVPAARTPLAFPATSRWLRGRILDRLRDAPDVNWVTFDGPIGNTRRIRFYASSIALPAPGSSKQTHRTRDSHASCHLPERRRSLTPHRCESTRPTIRA